jgi:hypothetical protein
MWERPSDKTCVSEVQRLLGAEHECCLHANPSIASSAVKLRRWLLWRAASFNAGRLMLILILFASIIVVLLLGAGAALCVG